jgi:hypothetical protein
MEKETAAILISVLSALIAIFSLGWNVYRDILLRPKLKVGISLSGISHLPWEKPENRIIIFVTNYGPGRSRITNLRLRKGPFWKRWFTKCPTGILYPDHNDPFSSRIADWIDPGASQQFTFKVGGENFVNKKEWYQVGVADPFGKDYWAPRKSFRKTQKQLSEPDATGQRR